MPTIYCTCETPIMDVEHDAGCRRCGRPVNFNPKPQPGQRVRVNNTASTFHGLAGVVVRPTTELMVRVVLDGRHDPLSFTTDELVTL